MNQRPSGSGVIVALMSITLIASLAVHVFFPLMPQVKRAFGISDALVGLAFSISLMVMACVTLVYGSLSDRYGRRPVLLTGLALFCAGSALTAIAGSVEVLLAGRVLQAAGAGCGVTLARAIARDTYGTESLVKVVAWLTIAATLGPMVTPLFAGMLADTLGWRGVFWLCLLAGLVIIVAVYRVLPETRPTTDLALQSANVLRNHAVLLTQPRFLAFVLTAGFASGTFMTQATSSAFLMQDYLGRSATEFGVYFSLFSIGYISGNLISSRLARRASVETMVLVGALLHALVVAGQAVVVACGYMNPAVLFIPGFLCTFTHGLLIPNAQVGAIRVKPHLSGTAAGIGVFCQLFIGASFSQLYVMLSDGTPMAMIYVTMAGGTVAAIAGVIPFAMRRRGAGA